jgi:ribose 5-phosphate isomerase B
MKIAVAADHAGLELKNHARKLLESLGHEVTDVGAHTFEPADDYPDFAEALGKAVASGEVERGVLICGSGVGASIAANKIRGVRAAICHDSYSAHQGVEHDDMNVLVLGSRVIGAALAEDLVRAFLQAKFTNEPRHARRLAKVKRIENAS